MTHHLPFGVWRNPKLKPHITCTTSFNGLMLNPNLLIKGSDYWFPLYTYMAQVFFPDLMWDVLHSCLLASIVLQNKHQRRPFCPYFLVWFPSRSRIWISPLSQPPSKLQTLHPSLFFPPCLLSPFSHQHRHSVRHTESEWKIWLIPSLTLDNVQACWQAWHH